MKRSTLHLKPVSVLEKSLKFEPKGKIKRSLVKTLCNFMARSVSGKDE